MIVRIGLALAIVTVAAFAICGCWLPAVELAPLAISAAEGVGSTVFGLAEGTVVMAHQGNEQVPDSSDEDGMDREDRCEELETDVPGVIELRRGPNGEPEYRELNLAARSMSHGGRYARARIPAPTDGVRRRPFSG